MKIRYEENPSLTVAMFIDILERSTLAERRPVSDKKRIEGMLKNADIIITAHADDKVVGVARAVSDFHYCCYLSDLAVDSAYQHQGIGKKLIDEVEKKLENGCKIILLSAPAATKYYPKIGFNQHPSAWVKGK
jgi:ribosomal protein S18 acetylase RimI-like enzyme